MTDPAYLRLGLSPTASPLAVVRAAAWGAPPRHARRAQLRKRFYRQMLCQHAARQAAADQPPG